MLSSEQRPLNSRQHTIITTLKLDTKTRKRWESVLNTLLVCHRDEAKVLHQGAELVTKLLTLNVNVKLKTTEAKPKQQNELG
ncbi:hypothetical protein [Vibrio splendidus]|uniref:Uncharacterized protein n=1 Tax=Vibrio splendidus 12E03 TaxID=1191305 RepID=A0A1E5FCM8_VIBSP|nr:hypothetical protein [Vibrio splendidus]OEF86801.1 hypothetical protein A142_10100 [Vibrio splendidus 12E03]